jgi:hypothetical protein
MPKVRLIVFRFESCTRIKTLQIQIILLFLMGIGTTSYGQHYEPLELAQRIFGKEILSNIAPYIIGEYKGRPNGQDLRKGTTTQFALLGQTEKTAVVSMTVLDSLGKGIDTYLHFKKDTFWKMNAFRALAMTGIIEEMKKELEKMTPEQVSRRIGKEEKGKKENSSLFHSFKSQEDYDFQLGNAKLTLELDSNIIKHFWNHQLAFESLKNQALKQLEKEKGEEERSIALLSHLEADYQKLFIFSVSAGGYELGNGIQFLIGGMVDNTVGYLFVKDKKDLPPMNPDRVIMIKEIGKGWYLYKTT